MTVRVRIAAGDVVAIAELDEDGSPDASRAFAGALPIEGELLGSMWSGNACELALPSTLAGLVGTGRASTEVPVGSLALAPTVAGPILMIAYGETISHTATGPAPASRLGRIVEGQEAFLARLARTFDEGAIPVRLTVER